MWQSTYLSDVSHICVDAIFVIDMSMLPCKNTLYTAVAHQLLLCNFMSTLTLHWQSGVLEKNIQMGHMCYFRMY